MKKQIKNLRNQIAKANLVGDTAKANQLKKELNKIADANAKLLREMFKEL